MFRTDVLMVAKNPGFSLSFHWMYPPKTNNARERPRRLKTRYLVGRGFKKMPSYLLAVYLIGHVKGCHHYRNTQNFHRKADSATSQSYGTQPNITLINSYSLLLPLYTCYLAMPIALGQTHETGPLAFCW